MRKLPHLAIGLALSTVAVIFLTRSLMLTAAAVPPQQPQTISIDKIHRTLDLTALPVREVREPF
jgi:hypothetical protein